MGILDVQVFPGHPAKAEPKPQGRPPTPKARVAPARSLGLTGASPFSPAMAQAKQRVRQAAQKLPNPPSSRQVAQGYRDSLTAVFDHQPHAVRDRIVTNAIRQRSPEGDVILRHFTGLQGDKLEAFRRELLPSSPFGAAQNQADRAAQKAVEGLPNPPRLFQAPELPSYTPQQKDLILREQGPRLSALAKDTGLTGNRLASALPSADARQVALFARLAGERQRSVTRKIGPVVQSRIVPGHKPSLGDKAAAFGAAFISPKNNLFAAVAPAAGRLSGPVVSDAANLVVNSPLALYQLGDAGVQAAQGNLEPAKRIGQGLASGAIGHLVRGDLKGAERYVGQHPLFAALEFSGAEGALGRTAGAAMRSGVLGAAAKAAASTARAPIVDSLGRTLLTRSYSKDVLRKAGQVAYDKARFRDGVPKSVSQQSRLSNAAVDEFAGMQENLRRVGRGEATRRMGQAIPTRGTSGVARAAERLAPARVRPERNILQAVVERRVLTHDKAGNLLSPEQFAAELRTERDRLANAFVANRERMSSAQRVANREQVRNLDRVLADPKALANVAGIDRAARSYEAAANLTTARKVQLGLLERDQATAAELRPYAVAKMGARYDATQRAPEHMLDRYEQAQQAEHAAGLKVAAARQAHFEATGAEKRLALQARRDAERELRSAQRQRQRSNPKQYVTGLVGPDGRKLTTDEIAQHMQDNGVTPGAFVSHRMDTTGPRAFLVNWFDRRRTADAHTRTGRSTELGAHASDFPSMAQQHVHGQGVVDAVHGFDRFVNQFGVTHPSGRMFTWDEAQALSRDPTPIAGVDSHGNPIPGRERLVPVRVVPARYSPQTREAIAGMQDATPMPPTEHLVEERLRQSQLAPEGAARKVQNTVLVPESNLKRFAEHQQRSSSTGAKLAQVGTNLFRSTVLPFSTKWVTGNTVEAALRLSLVGATPRDPFVGRRLVQALEQHDAAAAREFRARVGGGLLFGGSQKLAIHRDAESFKGTRLEGPALAAGALRRSQPVKLIAGGIMGLGRGIFALNRALEQGSQYAAVGKFARTQMQEVTGSWLKSVRAAQPALDDLAKGLVHTPAQVRYARYIDETLGKYSRFGPTERRIFQTIAPFAPWYLNSLRFVFWTLPAHHPVKQALIANVENTFQKDFQAQHANVPPGDLKGGIVRKDGGIVPWSRYMPFGAFTASGSAILSPNGPSVAAIGDNLSQLLLPQFASSLAALRGKSWTGADLRTSHGKAGALDQILIALNSLGESTIPGMALGRRLREGGLTAWDDSTLFSPKTKPGTKHGSAANRVFNPFRPTYLKKAAISSPLLPGGASAPAGAAAPSGASAPAGAGAPIGVGP